MERLKAGGWIATAAVCLVTLGAAPSEGSVESSQNRTARPRSSQQSRPTTSSELRKLNSRTVSLKAENDSLKVRVAQLEAAFESFSTVVPDLRRAVGETVSTRAAMDSAGLALVNQLSLVLNKISLLEDKAGYIDSTNFEILTQLVLVENKIVSLATSFNDVMAARQPGRSMSSDKMTDDEFRGRYIKALTSYQNGQYKFAREQFTELTQIGMDHELADNAQYWLAECYYSTRNFKRAIDEFEKVMPYRGTDKADDAQYKIGLSYWSAGDYVLAKSAMEKLLADYPETSLADQARRYLQ